MTIIWFRVYCHTVQAPSFSYHSHLMQIKREGKWFEAGSDNAHFLVTGEREPTIVCIWCKTKLVSENFSALSAIKNLSSFFYWLDHWCMWRFLWIFDFFSLWFTERIIGILVLYLLEMLYNISQSKRDMDKWEMVSLSDTIKALLCGKAGTRSYSTPLACSK